MTNSSVPANKSGSLCWIHSISPWDTSFHLYFWGDVFINSIASGGPCYISKSGDLPPIECCGIAEKGDGTLADLKASEKGFRVVSYARECCLE